MKDGESRIFYGVGLLQLHLPYSRSLKEKRAVLKSLKDRIAERSRIAVVDAGSQDLWQSAVLGICAVGRDDGTVRSILQAVQRTVEEEDRAVILSFEKRIGNLGGDAYEVDE
jgi:uncharacterized protein